MKLVALSALGATSLTIMAAAMTLGAAKPAIYDYVIRGGEILDGSGGKAVHGDVAVRGDRIAYVGPHAPGRGKAEIDAHGKVVAPGFINMLSHSEDSLIADGRGQSELRQGVTLEVMGEGGSIGPLTPKMQRLEEQRQHDIKYPVDWTTLDGGLESLAKRGLSMNVASFVGAATVRVNVLGEDDVQPTPAQLADMRRIVRRAMEDGAMGVGSALIYAPGTFARTDELAALTTEAGRCGGIYISHMRSEGDRLIDAADELIEISRRSGAPAEIFHMKVGGRDNWPKEDMLIAHIEAARAKGQRITADMYTYPAGSTGFDAAMPTWVQAGGTEAWIARLRDPATRAKVPAVIRSGPAGPSPTTTIRAATTVVRGRCSAWRHPHCRAIAAAARGSAMLSSTRWGRQWTWSTWHRPARSPCRSRCPSCPTAGRRRRWRPWPPG